MKYWPIALVAFSIGIVLHWNVLIAPIHEMGHAIAALAVWVEVYEIGFDYTLVGPANSFQELIISPAGYVFETLFAITMFLIRSIKKRGHFFLGWSVSAVAQWGVSHDAHDLSRVWGDEMVNAVWAGLVVLSATLIIAGRWRIIWAMKRGKATNLREYIRLEEKLSCQIIGQNRITKITA